MKRLLFVDDEPLLLDGLRALLRRHRDRWELSFVSSADAALARLAVEPFDLLISDLKMPGMNGERLLERVREEHPRMLRLLLSGHADSVGGLRTLPAAQRILSKPCDGPSLIEALQRACDLHDLMEAPTLVALTGGSQPWPALPMRYREFSRLWAEPAVRHGALAACLEADPGVAEALLRVARASALGAGPALSSVADALAQLGPGVVRHLLLWVEAARAFAGAGLPSDVLGRAEAHALRVARAAKRVAGDAPDAELAVAAALLHDLGELVLRVRRPEAYRRCDEAAVHAGAERYLFERDALGVGHAEVGAALACRWGLHLDVVEAVAFHHEPAAEAPEAAATLHLADQLAYAEEAALRGPVAAADPVHAASQLGAWREDPVSGPSRAPGAS